MTDPSLTLRPSGTSRTLASRARLPLGASVSVDPATVVLASLAWLVTFWIAAYHQEIPYDVSPGAPARAIAWASPGIAATVASLAILAPGRGFLAALFLAPLLNVAQVQWWAGSVQVLLQTVLAVAIVAGWLISKRRDGGARAAFGGATARPAFVWAGAFGALVLLSTLASSIPGESATVALHGIAEPLTFALLLILFRPDARQIGQLLVVLGLSVALGGAINLVQTLPTVSSLAQLQDPDQRLLLARLTYFNTGLFGEILAMSAPLLLGALLVRRRFGLGRGMTAALLVALGVAAVSLFLTFSKSGWLATAAGALVLFLLTAAGWRRRAAILAVAFVASAFVVPWPAAALRPISAPAADAYDSFMVGLVGESRFESWDPETRSGRGSIVERWYATEAAIRIAFDHPLLGIGLDQFQEAYGGPYHPAGAHLDLRSAHDFWPNIAAELGLPALLLVMLAFGAALVAAWQSYRAPPDELTRWLGAMLVAALVAWIVVATTFDPDLYRPWRHMSTDIVTAAVLAASAFALRGHVAVARWSQ